MSTEKNDVTELTETVGLMTEESVDAEQENEKTVKAVKGGSKNRKRKQKKKIPAWGIVLIVIAFIGGVTGLAFAAKNAMGNMQTAMQEAMDQMSGDDLYTVEKIDIEQEISTSGTTIGLEENAYTSPVTAKVEDILVEVGQTVHKGDVLLTYDTSDLDENLAKVKIQARSEQAASNQSYESADEAADKVKAAKKKVKKYKEQVSDLKEDIEKISDSITTYEDLLADTQTKNAKEETNAATPDENGTTREPKLEDTKAITQTIRDLNKKLTKKNEELADKQSKLAEQQSIVSANKDVKVSESTKAQISASKELSDITINDAQESLDEGEAGITAEKDGVVSSIGAVKGSYASETQTLFTIIDGDKLGVQFTISKDDLGAIQPGQKARIVIGSRQYEGKVDYISRVASSETGLTGTSSSGGSIQGKITIDNPDENLFIGVSAKVYVFVGKSESTFGVPYEALNTDINGDYVYVVDKDNKIQRKDVTIGIYSDEYYEITEGIEEGDRVIREVTKNMKPGDDYVPATPAMPGMMVQ
mgnify:CR=1 FL=1